MRLGKFLITALVVAMIATPVFAHAAACSNTQIRNQMTTDAQNLSKQRIQAMATGWQQPNSFNSLYCGMQIRSMFDQLGSGLGGMFASLVKNLLTNLMNQACQSAIAPIQNAASKLCIPNFSLGNFNLNLSLPGGQGYCNGMQLLTVTPVVGSPAGAMGNYGTVPLLP